MLTLEERVHQIKPEILGLVRHNVYRPNSEDTSHCPELALLYCIGT